MPEGLRNLSRFARSGFGGRNEANRCRSPPSDHRSRCGLEGPPRSYVPISAPIRASKRRPDLEFCEVLSQYPRFMLGQGCLRAFFWRTIHLHWKVGLSWVLSMSWNGSKSGSNVGFWVQKWVKMRQNPLLHPLKTHFGIFTKTHFLPSLKGGWKLFSKNGPDAVPTQHNPRSAFPGVLGHQRGSAAVCDPNPPRPFAWYRSIFSEN